MKEFLQLQPKKWKEIYSLYFDISQYINIPTREEQINNIKKYLMERDFDDAMATYIANTLLDSFNRSFKNYFIEQDENPENTEAKLTIQDIQQLKARLLHESSPDVRRLLVAYLVYARANPHPSNWIKNDKKVIHFLASIQKLKVSDQILLTNRLHNLYNLDMRVVGSNQPIPCFRISWQADQPAPNTEENFLVYLGPLNPATIKAFAEQIPYEPEEQSQEEKTHG